MRRRHLVGVLAAIALLTLGWTAPARANADQDALREANKKVSAAQWELTKAKVAVQKAARKIEGNLEATPEWKEAAAAAKQATAAQAAAVKAAKDALAQKPEYKAAVAERDRRRAERDALR